MVTGLLLLRLSNHLCSANSGADSTGIHPAIRSAWFVDRAYFRDTVASFTNLLCYSALLFPFTPPYEGPPIISSVSMAWEVAVGAGIVVGLLWALFHAVVLWTKCKSRFPTSGYVSANTDRSQTR